MRMKNNPKMLRKSRAEKGMTQEQLAERSGISLKSIKNIEAGKTKASEADTIRRFADALGVAYEELHLGPAEPEYGPQLTQHQTLLTQEEEPRRIPRGVVPPKPSLIVGRDSDLADLRMRIGNLPRATKDTPIQIVTPIRGLPGVGKTTVVSEIAHDQGFQTVLYTAIGVLPSTQTELTILTRLQEWGRALDSLNVAQSKTLDDARASLAALLRDERALIVIDDVWESPHAVPFLVGGRDSVTLIATRDSRVARDLSSRASDIYTLDCLSLEDSIALLRHLAPDAVESHPEECSQLAERLEGLPIALQVAGRMLLEATEHDRDIPELLAECEDLTGILERTAPCDMTEVAQLSTPTVAALLKKSTDSLPVETRRRFALLGVIPPEPVSFSREYLAEYWSVSESEAQMTIGKLLDSGLLKDASAERYQIHGVIAALAKSLLKTLDE